MRPDATHLLEAELVLLHDVTPTSDGEGGPARIGPAIVVDALLEEAVDAVAPLHGAVDDAGWCRAT